MVTVTKQDIKGLLQAKNFDTLAVLYKILINNTLKGYLKDSCIKTESTYNESWPVFYIDLDELLNHKGDYADAYKVLESVFMEIDFKVLKFSIMGYDKYCGCFDEFVIDLESVNIETFTKDIESDFLKIQETLNSLKVVTSTVTLKRG